MRLYRLKVPGYYFQVQESGFGEVLRGRQPIGHITGVRAPPTAVQIHMATTWAKQDYKLMQEKSEELPHGTD